MSEPSLCLFSSYLSANIVPSYVKHYLFELKKHIDDVFFVTNKKTLKDSEIEILREQEIKILFVKNKGYDFGMYYQALQEISISNYKEIVLANDSCLLTNQLNSYFSWFRKGNLEMAGLLDSMQVTYHIQSYFLSFQGVGVSKFEEYLRSNKIINKKKGVIKTYEIGLSSWFSSIGLKIGSYYNSKDYSKNIGLNPAIFQVKELIEDGFPLIKRKLLKGGYTKSDLIFFAKNGLVIDPHQLKQLILETNSELTLEAFD